MLPSIKNNVLQCSPIASTLAFMITIYRNDDLILENYLVDHFQRFTKRCIVTLGCRSPRYVYKDISSLFSICGILFIICEIKYIFRSFWVTFYTIPSFTTSHFFLIYLGLSFLELDHYFVSFCKVNSSLMTMNSSMKAPYLIILSNVFGLRSCSLQPKLRRMLSIKMSSFLFFRYFLGVSGIQLSQSLEEV